MRLDSARSPPHCVLWTVFGFLFLGFSSTTSFLPCFSLSPLTTVIVYDTLLFFFLKPRKWHNQSELCLKLIWQHCTEREKWGADVQLESCYCSLGVRKLFLWHRLRAKKYEEERLGMNNAADAEESAGLGFGWSWTTGQRKKEFLVELHSLIQSLAPYGSALFAV